MGRHLFVERLETRCLFAADFGDADFNGDLRVDAADIDLLWADVNGVSPSSKSDLNGDGQITADDVDYLVNALLGTRLGDTDLDRDVDFEDFIRLANGILRPGGWSNGSFHGREQASFDDFVTLSTNYGWRATHVVTTYQSVDGNRYSTGWGAASSAAPLDVALSFTPAWVLGTPVQTGHLWVAVSDQGDVEAFVLEHDEVNPVSLNISRLPAGVPPALLVEGDSAQLLAAPQAAAQVPSHPIPVGDRLAYLDEQGNLVLHRANSPPDIVPIQALPDARILSDGGQRVLVLANPSTQYLHGIFGDIIEPTSAVIVDASVEPPRVSRVDVPDGKVIEGLFAMWADVDDDGEREIVVTLSDRSNGGQITIYSEQGETERQGPGIGRGFRWRHQLAVAPFGPQGELELVDVLTPHIGGVVEFRGLDDATLPIRVSVRGYTSHVNRSRNIDMAAAGDFDGDGVVELVLPNQRRTHLAGISRTAGGAFVDWELPLQGTLTSNVAVLRTTSGRLSLAAGRADNVLRIWSA